jgi:Cytochrome C oxidase, cbb3-type, subunit III
MRTIGLFDALGLSAACTSAQNSDPQIWSGMSNFAQRYNFAVRAFVLFASLVLSAAPTFAQSSDPQIWSGVFSTTQAERGRMVFTSHCARCHGPNRSLSDDVFMLHWEGHNLARLFRKIKESMPPGTDSALTDAEKLDALAYILQQNRFPEGQQDLSDNETSLEGISIVPRGGPRPLPTGAVVEVIGCLAQTPTSIWQVTNATEPAPTVLGEKRDAPDAGRSTIDDGRSTFQLLSPYPNPAPHAGRKVRVKGLLIRNPAGDRINVMALEPIGDGCAP